MYIAFIYCDWTAGGCHYPLMFSVVKNEVSFGKGIPAIAADMVCQGHAELGCSPGIAYQLLPENQLRR